MVGFDVRPVTDHSSIIAFERTAVEQVARDVIEPDALSQIVECVCRLLEIQFAAFFFRCSSSTTDANASVPLLEPAMTA